MAAQPNQEDCSSKTCFQLKIQSGSSEISLLGSKRFRYYLWTAYSIALYGPENARSIDSILSDVPKALVLEYHRDFKAQDIIEAANKLLTNNPEVDMSGISSQLEQLNRMYLSVKDGDRYTLRYQPGAGTSLILNGKILGTVAGKEFAKAYFGIWLSKYPMDNTLRDDLLHGH